MKEESSGDGTGATLMKTVSCEAVAVSFLRRLRGPEMTHTVAGHTDNPE